MIPGAFAYFHEPVDTLVGVDAEGGAGAGPRLDDDGITHVGDFQRRGAGVEVDVLRRRFVLGRGLFQTVTAQKAAGRTAIEDLRTPRRLNFDLEKSDMVTFPL